MNLMSKVICLLLIPGLTLAWSSNATAQLDRVYSKTGDNVSGTVSQMTRQGVVLKRGGNTQEFLAGDIEKILFEGDPPALTKGREFALDGQYDQALAELKTIGPDSLPRELVKADVAYFLVYSEAKLALSGKGAKDQAARNLLAFAGMYRDSWHFFDAAKLLGELSLALNDTDKAMTYFKSLMSAPSPDTKVESVYLQGLVNLRKKENEAAITEFNKVIGINAQSTQSARLQTLSAAGKAVALAQGGKSDEGITLVRSLIAELNPTDVEMAARIYNALGASYEAGGDTEGAILAYLHTHLMFSLQPDAHAEALKRLIELWPQVGKPERAAEARQELQQRYPGL